MAATRVTLRQFDHQTRVADGTHPLVGDILKTKDDAIGCGAAVDGSFGREPWESGRRFRAAAEQRRKTAMESMSLLRSSGLLCANDLRFHRRLPHAAALQRIAGWPPFNEYTRGERSRREEQRR